VQKAVGHRARRQERVEREALPEGHAERTGRSISYDVGVARDFDLFQTDVLQGATRRRSSRRSAQAGSREAGRRRAAARERLGHNAPHGYGAAALHENEADFDAGIAFAIWAAERTRACDPRA
jgi:hypothetical protein